MTQFDSLIGSIYEAGALPELWMQTLEEIASSFNAMGGNLIVATPAGLVLSSSPSAADITREFDEQGWNRENSRVTRLLERADHPGFLTDRDLHTAEELRTLPMYSQFLTPRGADAGAATVIMGANDDGIIVAFEAFRDHATARDAVPWLNRLRPHLARATVLSSRIQAARVSTLLDAFSAISIPVAMLDAKGKILSATDYFFAAARDVVMDSPNRLRIADPEADARLVEALGILTADRTGTSIALRDREKTGIAVLHLIPARRDARDLFSNVSAFAIIARPDNKSLPSVDIISALFDLTPAEARVARSVASGKSTNALSAELGISRETVRSHLKRAFAKTSTTRQSELASLISKLSVIIVMCLENLPF